MKKYYILFLAVICVAGIVFFPGYGYAKVNIMTDTELDSVAARAGIIGPGITRIADILGISLDAGAADLFASGNGAKGGRGTEGLSPVDISYNEDIHSAPATAYNFSVMKKNTFSFDVDLDGSFYADKINIGIFNSVVPETGIKTSMINFSITDLRVIMSGNMHVSVRF